MTLYELTADYMRLLELGENPTIDQQAFKDTLDMLDGEIEDKAEGYAKVMQTLKGEVDVLKAEESRIESRRKAVEGKITLMKNTLEAAMIQTNKRKFKKGLFSFNIQKNPPAVVIDGDVPEAYLIQQEPKIDKDKIKKEIKAGAKFTFAHLEQGEGLRIS